MCQLYLTSVEETEKEVTIARKEQVPTDYRKPSKTHMCTYEKVPAADGKNTFPRRSLVCPK